VYRRHRHFTSFQLETPPGECPQRLQEQRDIEKQGTMQNVFEIVASLVFRRILIAKSEDLCQAGDSRRDTKSLAVPIGIVSDPVGRFRSGPHQAHVAKDDVQQLRQFGEAGLLHEKLGAR